MKKMKGLMIAVASFAMALTSCGTSGYYNTYQFQMGKQNGSHIGIYMDLTKDLIPIKFEEETKNMEKFRLSLSIPSTGSSSSEDEGETSLIGGLLTYFADGLEGGYEIKYSEELENQELTLVPVLDVQGLIDQITGGSSEEGSSSSEPSSSHEDFYVPSDVVKDIMIATYSKDSISITIPVSLTDLMYQLYWYGFDIFNPEAELEVHKHGSHPTAEDVAKINETFNSESLIPHVDLDALVKYKAFKTVNYRDFNQMTMTLKKAEL